jgi:thiol-disulfide isomerase/thioredoxin
LKEPVSIKRGSLVSRFLSPERDRPKALSLIRWWVVVCIAAAGLYLGEGVNAEVDLILAVEPAAAVPIAKPDANRVAAMTLPEPSVAGAGVIQLTNGDYARGVLKPAGSNIELMWQAEPFETPLTLPHTSVKTIRFAVPRGSGASKPTEGSPLHVNLDLNRGDFLQGELVSLTPDRLVIETQIAGRLHLDPRQVRRLTFSGGGRSLLFRGPRGTESWEITGPTFAWNTSAAGGLVSNQPETSVTRNIGIPELAMVELELAWKGEARFAVGVGAAQKDKLGTRAFRLEVWKNDLVLLRELVGKAEVKVVKRGLPKDGQIRLKLFLDQKAEQITVLSTDGEQMAQLTLPAASDGTQKKPVAAIGGDIKPIFADRKGEAKPKPPASKHGEWFALTNHGDQVELVMLTVGRWDGVVPQLAGSATAATILRLGSGESLPLAGVTFEKATQELVLEPVAAAEQTTEGTVPDDKGTDTAIRRRVPLSEVQELVSMGTSDAGEPGNMVAAFGDGSRLHGKLSGVSETEVTISNPVLLEPAACSFSQLMTLGSTERSEGTGDTAADGTATTTQPEGATEEESGGRMGTLNLEGLSLKGKLVPNDASQGWLMWQASLARGAVAIKPGQNGMLVYREPPPKPTSEDLARQAAIDQQQPAGGVVENIFRLFTRPVTPKNPNTKKEGMRHLLHLRSGDVIPCDVKELNAKGAVIASPVTSATLIPNERIKVVEIAPNAKPLAIAKTKRSRLLMLPRIKKKNLPTHLVRSHAGDYLRGRLVSLADEKLQIEMALDTRAVELKKVSRIIWLHEDEMLPSPTGKPETVTKKGETEKEAEREEESDAGRGSDAAPTEMAKAEVPGTNELGKSELARRVQAVKSDGGRITFAAETCDMKTLVGANDVLGVCRIDLMDIDRVVFGKTIETELQSLPFHSWKLSTAPDPLDDSELSGGEEGSESPLVGKLAPDFTLDLLEGGTFKLSGCAGEVVVLDFWASWCGPCLRSMPVVEKVTTDAGSGVRMVAVNLQEAPQRIATVVKRLGITTTVALDREGLIAEKYGASSIPHTVVVGPDGKVAKVFVGFSSSLEEQLRTTIEKLKSPGGVAKPDTTD